MKKIMFNDRLGLTQAVLDGMKTQTRRIVSDKIVNEYDAWYEELLYKPLEKQDPYLSLEEWLIKKAHYQAGEVVSVAQSYHTLNESGYIAPEWCAHECEDHAGYKNKMFVKASLMPHHIKITDVRMEHLQAISDEDCLREGVIKKWHAPACRNYFYVQNVEVRTKDDVFSTPQEAYAALIDKISGKGTWLRNPWVVVYEFEIDKWQH